MVVIFTCMFIYSLCENTVSGIITDPNITDLYLKIKVSSHDQKSKPKLVVKHIHFKLFKAT